MFAPYPCIQPYYGKGKSIWDGLQNGDVFCVHRTKGLTSRLIQWWTQEDTFPPERSYCHAGFIQKADGELFVVHSTFDEGVHRELLSSYLRDNEDAQIYFYRIIDPLCDEPFTAQQGKMVMEEAVKHIGKKYDFGAILGFIRQFTHKVFKFLPFKNPYDKYGRYYCVEYIRSMVKDALPFDVFKGIEEGFEAPNHCREPRMAEIKIG